MIRLLLLDIDGCLSEPYTPFRLDAFARLRGWIERAETDDRVPRIGLCSGRSYAYVEATAQALGLRAPALFESGGGRFDLAEARITWNAALTPAVEADLQTVRAFMTEQIVPRSETVSFDYGKRSQAGIVSPVVRECDAHLPDIEAFVAGAHARSDRLPHAVLGRCHPGRAHQGTRHRGPGARRRAAPRARSRSWATPSATPRRSGSSGTASRRPTATMPRAAAADTVTTGAVLDGVEQALAVCLRANGVVAE